jgi:hypothetical protein
LLPTSTWNSSSPRSASPPTGRAQDRTTPRTSATALGVIAEDEVSGAQQRASAAERSAPISPARRRANTALPATKRRRRRRAPRDRLARDAAVHLDSACERASSSRRAAILSTLCSMKRCPPKAR